MGTFNGLSTERVGYLKPDTFWFQGMEAEIQATLSAANVIAGDDAAAQAELNKRTKEQIELIPEL